jgi:hypothetical protein
MMNKKEMQKYLSIIDKKKKESIKKESLETKDNDSLKKRRKSDSSSPSSSSSTSTFEERNDSSELPKKEINDEEILNSAVHGVTHSIVKDLTGVEQEECIQVIVSKAAKLAMKMVEVEQEKKEVRNNDWIIYSCI